MRFTCARESVEVTYALESWIEWWRKKSSGKGQETVEVGAKVVLTTSRRGQDEMSATPRVLRATGGVSNAPLASGKGGEELRHAATKSKDHNIDLALQCDISAAAMASGEATPLMGDIIGANLSGTTDDEMREIERQRDVASLHANERQNALYAQNARQQQMAEARREEDKEMRDAEIDGLPTGELTLGNGQQVPQITQQQQQQQINNAT